MNAKRILNNYRAGKMPRSVYKKGGSKGRKLPMAQFMVGDQGMGQGQTMLEQQTGPSQIEIANNVLAYANQLVEQGNYKDTRKGRQKAFEDAQIAHGLVTPKQKSNFLDYFNAVTGLLGPVATTYSTIKGAKGQSNNPSISGGISGGMSGGMLGRMYGGPSKKLPKNQFRVGDDIGSKESAVLFEGPEITKELIDRGGTMTPEMRSAFIKRMAMNERALKSMLQEQAAQQALMGLAPSLTDFEIGVQPQPQSSGFLQDMINAAIQQGLQQGASPYMKRKGGAKRKAKYQTKGEFIPKPIPRYPGPMELSRGERQQISKLGGKDTAQGRVEQMKHGGSMCRGLPGGPNEFPM